MTTGSYDLPRSRRIHPPATGPEIGPARWCLLYWPVPERLRGPVECQRPGVDPHPRREPCTDNPHPPLWQDPLETPSSQEAVAAQDDGPSWYFRGLSLGLGHGSRYFEGRKRSGRRSGKPPLDGRDRTSQLLPPRRTGTRSAAECSWPWKRSFCSSRQDKNGTVSCRGPPATRLLTGFVFGSAPFDLGHAPGLDTGAGSGFPVSRVWVERHTASAGGSGTVELAAWISSPWHVSP